MPGPGQISPENLMSLETYAKWRKVHQPEMVALRQLRSVQLGEHLRVQFENEATVRYQIQEMLRVEKIFEEDGIVQEIAAYAPLVPDGSNWKATLLLGYPDAQERQRELAKLIGVASHVFVEVEGHPRIYAIADEDQVRDTATKTSAVHFLRFELDAAMVAFVQAGAGVRLGCDHTHYPMRTDLAAPTLASLAGDFNPS
ncbi:DUF3501 family protein [Limnohabitans sp. Jir72]|uniref:DUF3501 family protein n=1 Tax=Limnohabitans sp. Jir72 TaxID=1977909 RepID=UPI000D371DF4|nr:DUF3501 family protein [Limnohabitans sp. Jir72]PUE33729.1 hypothetical protein B9Z52_06330 [Limnohabitans sp. Jir72]